MLVLTMTPIWPGLMLDRLSSCLHLVDHGLPPAVDRLCVSRPRTTATTDGRPVAAHRHRVQGHRQGADRHEEGGKLRAHDLGEERVEGARSRGDRERVVTEGPAEVLLDPAHGEA